MDIRVQSLQDFRDLPPVVGSPVGYYLHWYCHDAGFRVLHILPAVVDMTLPPYQALRQWCAGKVRDEASVAAIAMVWISDDPIGRTIRIFRPSRREQGTSIQWYPGIFDDSGDR
ncbi:hypothetical protein HY933_01180 [Candidatus Falkowbacteria bacterium]|nr:hypothetical protein [Candidatus Falkowbacteria bacterium]